MIENLQKWIGALREELQECGEMLARMDYQQDLIMRRQEDSLLQSVAEIEAQGTVIQKVRRESAVSQSELARSIGLPEDVAFEDVMPFLPWEYRPLVQALIQENNELLVRVQQRSHQNHLLLVQVQRGVNS